jgi:shikimate 5-dehydrogenase
VKDLAGAGGAARDILYGMMLEHINRGKRARRLTARSQELLPTKPAATESEPPIEAHDEEEAVAQVTA